MEIKIKPSQIMMSKALEDNVMTSALHDIRSSEIVTATIGVIVAGGGRIEHVIGSVNSCELSNDEIDIDVTATLEDVFGLVQAHKDVKISNVELNYSNESYNLIGPYNIVAICMKDIVAQRQTAMLSLQLKK